MMSDGIVAAAKKGKPPTTILVPPRGAMESMFMNGSGPGFSPGPMTLISSFFSDSEAEQQSGSSSFSFSQLLAGAMASPMQQPDLLWTNADSAAAAAAATTSEDGEKSSESGYKRNRPSVNLVLENQSQSPLFMVPPGLTPSGFLNSPLQSPFGMSHQQALAHVTAQAALSQTYIQMQAQLQPSSSTDHYSTCTNHIIQTEPDYLKIESPQVSQSDRKAAAATTADKPANDGYNWRKYGQKQVKASECPRSYYKCTHLNCSVKKKVERSCGGRISEITYKGEHTHDPPQPHPTKRGKDNTSTSQAETNRSNEEAVHVHCEPQISCSTAQFEFENHPITGHGDENGDNPILLDYGYDDEPAPKRRSMDTVPLVPTSSQHTITESKIVVQTRSEVDYLDDGYKWRKYGQKVVKGNPNPRSYYRCTFAGCNVRKHVERASADPKSVVTTYEGKHNHDIPTGRFRGHASAQQVKAQKVEPKSRSLNEMDLWNKDQIPRTLHLKEEQLAA